MQVIKRSDRAKGVAAQWQLTYFRSGRWNHYGGPDKETTYLFLLELGPEPSPDDVDRIIGNTSWTQCRCDECDGSFQEVIQVGRPLDYDSATAHMCVDCLEYALRWLHEERSK